MRRPIFVALSGAALLLSLAGGTALAGNPSGTGQPNASCEESTLEPNGFSRTVPRLSTRTATTPCRSTTWPAIR
jgi:hypothetical protein